MKLELEPRPPDDSLHARRRDGGFSIVEIIVSIVLMGTVVVAILSAVGMSIKASSVSRSSAQVETAIVNAADRVNRAPQSCDYTIYAQAAVQIEGWPKENASVTQEYYVPGATAAATGTWVKGAPGFEGCDGVAPTQLLVQRVKVSIVSPDGQVRRSIEVVKSNV
jgi:type II secretory pathway pseudopilin PulG